MTRRGGTVQLGRVWNSLAEAQQRIRHLQQLAEVNAQQSRQLLIGSLLALMVMAVVSLLVGRALARRVLRPLRLITAAARRISADNLDQRLGVSGPADEVKDLADTIDGLLERLEASFAAQRRFANASHELRTRWRAQAFHADSSSSTVFVRADPNRVNETSSLLGPMANPAHPDQVLVSQPSQALSAQLAAQNAFNSLLLGLGGIALLVGAIGIANIMVIAVLERRTEIGLRRAIGAAKRHIWAQFLAESLTLSVFGGLGGRLIGIAVITGYAFYKHWQTVIPLQAFALGIGAAIGIGVIAGLYPAIRAARLTPTDGLRPG
jgi:HAMP domain-containing protein